MNIKRIKTISLIVKTAPNIAIMILCFSLIIPANAYPDQTPTGFGVKINDKFVWKTVETSGNSNYTYYERWYIISISGTNSELFANIESSQTGAALSWSLDLANEKVAYIGENGWFSIHSQGPKILPIPVNASHLVAQVAWTWAGFTDGENMTYNWDGNVLQVWDDYYPDFGDPIEDYYLIAEYSNAGVLLNWNETYHSGNTYTTKTIELISSSTTSNIPANTPASISKDVGFNISTSININTSATASISLTSISANSTPPNNTPLNDTIVYLEINASDADAGNINFPVTLVFNYTNANLTSMGINETRIAIWYLNSSGVWEELPSIVNTTARTVEIRLEHFSYYALAKGNPTIANTGDNGSKSGNPNESIAGYDNIMLLSVLFVGIHVLLMKYNKKSMKNKEKHE